MTEIPGQQWQKHVLYQSGSHTQKEQLQDFYCALRKDEQHATQIFSVSLGVKITALFLGKLPKSASHICLQLHIPETTFIPSAHSDFS